VLLLIALYVYIYNIYIYAHDTKGVFDDQGTGKAWRDFMMAKLDRYLPVIAPSSSLTPAAAAAAPSPAGSAASSKTDLEDDSEDEELIMRVNSAMYAHAYHMPTLLIRWTSSSVSFTSYG
jgi:hypothetical protein